MSASKNLVCVRCWQDFFSTPAYKAICAAPSPDERITYTASTALVERPASLSCSWCSFLLSLKPEADNVRYGDEEPLSTDIEVWYSSGYDWESFTPPGNNRFRIWINGVVTHLTAFTEPDSLAARRVTARSIQPDASDTYLALSYCWGPHQRGITTTHDVDARFETLEETELSRTVQDAIFVTRRLGYRYLWVDAICIIQDSRDDKHIELSRMNEIYRLAALTIVAANAHTSAEGFLADRQRPPAATSIPFWASDSQLGSVHMRPEGWYSEDVEPVNTRAWTLQEKLLSLRLLIYADHTLQYQCNEHYVNLGDSLNIVSGLGGSRLPLHLLNAAAEQSPDDEVKLAEEWIRVVSIYSGRALTYPHDKLPALSAIARSFHQKTGWRYLAGVWHGPLIPRFLLWSSTDYADPYDVYTAPSWSWASLCNPVAYRNSEGVPYEFEVTTADVTLETDILPFGAITGASLAISARVRSGRFVKPQSVMWGEANESDSGMYASIDAKLPVDEVPVLGVAIIRRKTEDPTEPYAVIDGLLIAPVDHSTFHRRIGVFFGSLATDFQEIEKSHITLL
ncbi:hypothetical protein LTR09_011788 [Extremus antarcticus]|uniref:Heterokaryon incompatibility domain-containing protein n=1 Tax=Extremus antarcticus TaxID=702011 RepID=A0AAJ0D5Y2_9PEZI|nr:hypothetical protein LTR09_011788 [Extremus antarcticus]